MPADLFDPPANNTTPARDVWTVSRLNQDVKVLLDRSFGLIWLQGEISNFSRPASGHFYFSLKDSLAQIRCAMFKNRNRYLDFMPENGVQILARGRLGLYEARGEYQFIVEHIEEVGSGALQRQFEQRFEKLKAEGLFDEDRKQAIPELPQRIGIVTSPTGAAVRDALDVLARRFPIAEIFIYPSQVQGNSAAAQIAKQISNADSDGACDTLLVMRGGGSIEDLWAFNEEVVVRAIAACETPIISGVGHETDFTLADFAADLRAPTPSAAAELACPDHVELQSEFRAWQSALQNRLAQNLARNRGTLGAIVKRLHLQHPQRQLEQRHQRCDELLSRLNRAIAQQTSSQRSRLREVRLRLVAQSPRRMLERQSNALRQLSGRLKTATEKKVSAARSRLSENMHALHVASPMATLERGYSITHRGDSDAPLMTVENLENGDSLRTRLANGTVVSEVVDISSEN
ncbi:MAG: exodeoxyribonuclease VII large subunit [Pseudomonadota bacterium]